MPPSPEKRISAVFVDVSVRELFDEVTASFSCWSLVTTYAVRIYPDSVPKPVYATAAFPIPPELLLIPASDTNDPFAPGPMDERAVRISANEFLRRIGTVQPGHSSAVYDEKNARLIVRAPLEELERVSKYLRWSAENP